jgi:hypothetical protein
MALEPRKGYLRPLFSNGTTTHGAAGLIGPVAAIIRTPARVQ